ncbi:hypothetical protein [Gordonia paraffinivorans]|uniref:hypothetical protein n=1 Tax=Gordonia paraffinivorans TaxID=175628 RepID=UPI001447C8B4|nr:hypothetical protein [Gordonia paraffinivorans]
MSPPSPRRRRPTARGGSPQALPAASPEAAFTGLKKFLYGVAPGGLLLLGAVAMLGSGSFLDSLRSLRS